MGELRHSFASRALALGESLPMIGKLLGHTQVQTTARYAHRTPPVKTAPPVCCIRHDFGDRRLAGGVVVGSWRAARG